jgi:DNA polymerase III subunit epsilon
MSDAPTRPPWASRRIHWAKVGFAALDFETSGLDANDTVVSFGVVPVLCGRIALAGSIYRTVGAASELSARSIVVHGLLPGDLANSPPMHQVRPMLRDTLEGRFLLTWAAEVEAAFLAKLFGGAPRRWLRRSVDVLGLAIFIDRLEGRKPDRGDYALTSAAERSGVPVEQPHHAFDDALTTAQLFLKLASKLSHEGFDTPRRLIGASRSGRR